MRQYNNISQNELAAMSGVRQPMIARIEHGINTPNMSTILKLLAAFGKTLSIVDIQDENIRNRNAKWESYICKIFQDGKEGTFIPVNYNRDEAFYNLNMYECMKRKFTNIDEQM